MAWQGPKCMNISYYTSDIISGDLSLRVKNKLDSIAQELKVSLLGLPRVEYQELSFLLLMIAIDLTLYGYR